MSSSPNPASPTPADAEFSPLGGGPGPAAATGHSIDLVQFVLDRWKQLAAGSLVGLLLGVGFYLYSGPRYVASVRLLVSKPPGTPLQEGGVSTFGDTGGHVHLIQSHVIVGRAFENHQLSQLPTLRDSDEPLTDVIDGLQVKRTAGQNRDFQSIIDIAYTSASPQDAEVITQAVVEAYDEYLARVRRDNTQEVLDLFHEADVKLQSEIARLEQEYQEFRVEAPILFTGPVGTPAAGGTSGPTTNHHVQEVDRIRINLQAVRNRRTDLFAQQEVLAEMIAEGVPRQQIEHLVMLSLTRPSASAGGGAAGTGTGGLFAGPPGKDRLDSELLRHQVDAARLAHHIGDDHPAAVKTRRAIDVVLEAYQAQGLAVPDLDSADPAGGESSPVDVASVYGMYLETQLRQLDYAEQALEDELDAAIAEAKRVSTYELRDRQLSEELRRKKDLYHEMVQRLEKLDLTRDQSGFRMQPMSAVLVEKSLKRVLKVLGAFTLLGVLPVFGLLYYRELQDLSLKTVAEVRRHTGSVVMGSVPHFAIDPSQSSGNLSSALCYFHRPGSREAEAFRSVRTTLFFSSAGENDRIIQISSPEPNDGKSTSAANLAIAIANAGKRVLLIDCDLRRPTVHRLFGVADRVGLTDVLRGEIEWINALQQTSIDGLSLMTAGDPPPNPAELLSTSRLADVLKSARQEFDYILIDSPPLLAVSDPAVILPAVDGMLLVVRMQKNRRPAVIRAREIIEAHGGRLYGVIANDISSDASGPERYEQYSEYYNTTRNEPVLSKADAPGAHQGIV